MTVYTVGTFDLLHVGHLALLDYCRTLGDSLAVGVASDEVVNSYKPNVPVIPLEQRVTMLKALRCVDIVRPLPHARIRVWLSGTRRGYLRNRGRLGRQTAQPRGRRISQIAGKADYPNQI